MKNNKPDDQRERERLNIERLVEETFMKVESLKHLAERKQELLIPIARRQLVWPAFISRKSAFQKQNAELMNKIQLGKESGYSEGEWQPDSPSTRAANLVYQWGKWKKSEWKLPTLTRKNKRKWFDKVWRCLIKKLHIIPEQDALLRLLGKSAKMYYKREDSEKRAPLAMRAEIQRQIWKAFDRLVLPNK
jgi:hypothetical protein